MTQTLITVEQVKADLPDVKVSWIINHILVWFVAVETSLLPY